MHISQRLYLFRVLFFNRLREVSVVEVWRLMNTQAGLKHVPELAVFAVVWLLIVGSMGIIPSECSSHRWSDPNEPD